MLNAEQLRDLLSYDPNTGEFLWKRTLSPNALAGSVAGSMRPRGYRQIRISGRYYFAHRLAWLYMRGRWPSHEIDHINMDCRDNRFVNLREATRSENARNAGIRSTNTSGFKGVTWDKSRGKWLAHIKLNGREIHLGRHKTPEEAHAAYCKGAEKHHGEFARAH